MSLRTFHLLVGEEVYGHNVHLGTSVLASLGDADLDNLAGLSL
jgi:hypothetical protein